MKKAFVLISALLFASCSFWNEPVEEFFSYWSAEAYITDSSVSYPNQPDGDGVINVASNKAAIVILKTVNPKSFRFIMPSSGNTGMIHFNGFETQPEPDTDYTLEQISADKLKLTFKQEFLKQYEWGAKDLGASLTLFADDGRKFNKPYTFKIKSNTMPPTPTVILAKTRESTPHYVLCLSVPDMNKRLGTEKIHKDIAQIVINESSYELKLNASGLDFVKPTDESFITWTDVAQLTGAEAVPTGKWILYYKTDREVGGAYKTYEIKLKDEKGVCSEPLKTGTSLNKLPSENVTIVAGEEDSGTGTKDEPIIIKPANSTSDPKIEISHSTSGAAVYCTVIEDESTTPMQYTGNPVTVPLALGGANEKTYEIKYHSECTNYNPSDVQTKYYKILKLHTVTFNANGGKFSDNMATSTATALHGRKVTAPSVAPTRDGYVLVGWYKEQNGTIEWGFDSDTIMEDTTLYAKWTDDVCIIQAWRELKTEVESGTRSVIVIDGEIKATNDSGNSGEITIGRNLTIQGKTGAASDKLNVNSQNHRIFKVTDGKTLTLKNLTLKGGKGEVGGNGGGAIYAEGPLSLKNCIVNDNRIEYGNGGGICAESTLTMESCTVNGNTAANDDGLGGGGIYAAGRLTMQGCTISGNYAKKDGGGIYAVGNLSLTDCTVTANESQNNGYGSSSGSGSGGGIYAKGSCTMTGGSVTGNKANSNGNGGGIYIDGNGSFTMTGVTVSSNTTVYGDGGGIYIAENGSLTMTDGAVSSNTTQHGLGGGIFVSGTSAQFTMKDSAYITPSSAGEENQQGKNDVYLHDDANIMLSAALTGTAPAARITVPHIKYDSATKVLAGTAALLNSEHSKFTVTPQTLSGGKILYWEVDAAGKLMRIVDGTKYPNSAWKALKDVVSVAGADPITINGRIQATDDADNKGTININGSITIKGKNGRDTDILDAGKKGGRIFIINDSLTNKLTLEKLTLKGGFVNGNDGAAILVGRDAEAELSACTIEECEALNGGAIAIWATGTATLKNTDIKNCSAKLFSGNTPPNGSGGAIYAAGGTVIMTNCTLTGNTAENNGGAVYAKKTSDLTPILSTVTIKGGTIGGAGTNANKATGTGEGLGGGIYIGESCVLNMKDYTDSSNNKHGAKVISNTAKAKGGAIYTKGGKVTMTNCTLKGNEAKSGGAICAEKDGSTPSNVTISGGTIGGTAALDANKASKSGTDGGSGGGIWINNGTLILKDNAEVIGNTAQKYGGGIALDKGGTLTLSSGKISGNTAQKYGGGICIGTDANTNDNTGTVTMSGGEVSNNTASEKSGGGVVVLHGTFTMSNGKVSGNTAKETGGGIYGMNFNSAKGEITVSGGEISGNTANMAGTLAGGGIRSSYKLTVSGGTIKTNKTTKPSGWGGGISVSEEFTFLGGTVVGNTCPGGGTVQGTGIHVWNCSVKMSGSAKVDINNDIYLSTNIKITVIAPLTGTDPVARITPETYNTSTQVLEADSSVNLANETYKFAVTPQTSTAQPWTVGGNGYLKQGRYTEVPHGQLEAYLANNASATEVNYIEVTGTIPAADLKRPTGSPGAAALGEKIKAADPKKVALKLPDGLSDVTSMRGCFAVCRNLISVENIPSNVTDMCCCFYYCESLITAPDIPSGVTNMSECFRFCSSLTTAPVIPSGVENMAFCFEGCTSLTTVPNIPATVTRMAYCFNGCTGLTTAPDIPSSVSGLKECFKNCTSLKRVKIKCNYVSGNFNDAFKGCTALEAGGIKVPSAQFGTYKANAGTMGTTEDKFSAF